MKNFLFLLGLAIATPALAQGIDELPKVHAKLVAEDLAVPPGGSITVALEEDIREGWHTYWVNPGDAGAASEIKWTLPQGWRAGAIQWPTPKRLPVGPLMDYGYEGKLWLLQKLTVPADAKVGDTITLKAAAPCRSKSAPRRQIPAWRRISPPRAICCRSYRPGS
jgi:DsbC/DsbD-like thiol-disulfide interchange protein